MVGGTSEDDRFFKLSDLTFGQDLKEVIFKIIPVKHIIMSNFRGHDVGEVTLDVLYNEEKEKLHLIDIFDS